MDSEKKVNQRLSDYATVLAKAEHRLQEMLAAFNANEFAAGHNKADDIGDLYFPDDLEAASKIANLVKMVASAMYFGGTSNQVKVHNEEQAKARERKFSPPF